MSLKRFILCFKKIEAYIGLYTEKNKIDKKCFN